MYLKADFKSINSSLSEIQNHGMRERDVKGIHIGLHVHFRTNIDQCPETGYTILLQILYISSQFRAKRAWSQGKGDTKTKQRSQSKTRGLNNRTQ